MNNEALRHQKKAATDAGERLAVALRQAGAVLIRHKNHYVYRLPNGRMFSHAKTSSDPITAERNNIANLRRMLGQPAKAKAKPASQPKPRRRKPNQSARPTQLSTLSAPATSDFRRKLLEAGYAAPPVAKSTKENPKADRKTTRAEKPKCFTYPPEVLAEANRILHDQGQAAFNEFLNKHREQAVEYLPVRHTHVKEVSLSTQLTSIELRVKLARERIEQLNNASTQAGADILNYRAKIDDCSRLIDDNAHKIEKLQQFISAYDLITEEEKQVEAILNPIERMELRQHDHHQRPTLVRRNHTNPAMSLEAIIQRSRPLLDRPNGANISDIFALLTSQEPTLRKSTVYNAFQYEFRKHGCTRISRIGKGAGVRYVSSEPLMNNNGNEQQQLAVGA